MYISTFTTMNTALSGVEAAQEELDTTGNNIANANQAGYEEQRVNLVSNPALNLAGGHSGGTQLGTGVDASSITNQANPYLDNAFRTQNGITAAADTTQSYAAQLQSLLGENNNNAGAISAQLSQFWTDWNSLSDNPSNAGAQQAVVDDGGGLASTFNQISAGITDLQHQAQTQYANLTAVPSGPGTAGGEVYNDAIQIAQLNVSIRQAQEGGLSDNSLIDQRNAVIDDLSTLATTAVVQNSDGTVTVNFGGTATPLVDGSQATAAGMVTWPQTLSADSGGTLGALIGMQSTIGAVGSQLDAVAGQLAGSVNALTTNSTSSVSDFFTGSSAGTLAVDPALAANAGLMPSTSTANAGGNDIAVAVAGLAGGAPDQAYQAFVQTVGAITQQANNDATNQGALLTQISNQRLSSEGVDVNQEMANLVQEQQAFEASAKVMGAFSTMMDALMQVVGQ